MKKLILNITCANNYCIDAPNCFIVELNKKTIDRIKHLSEVAKENNVDYICYDDASGELFSLSTLTTLTEQGGTKLDASELTVDMVEWACDESRYVDYQQVVVSKTHFKFTSVPKHGDHGDVCNTALISINELNDESVYCDL